MPELRGTDKGRRANEVFLLEAQPQGVLIVGGGDIAVEFAGSFNGLGSNVVKVYRGPLFLSGVDNDVRENIAGGMRKHGVDLRFDFEACDALGDRVRSRIRQLAAGRIGKDGRLRFICGRRRERTSNLKECEQRLRDLVRQALAPPPKKRKPTKPTRGSQRRRIESKKRRGITKKMRGKVTE